MKGIQKLFLGLFLVALISVGFKVEAKAAPAKPTVDWSLSAGGNLQFSFNSADFPTANETEYVYSCNIQDSGDSNVLSEIKVTLGRDNGGTTYSKYQIDGATPAVVGLPTNVQIMTKTQLEDYLDDHYTSDTVSLYVNVQSSGASATDPAYESFGTTPKFVAAKITLDAQFTGVDPKTVEFDPVSPFYLVEGTTQAVTVTSPGKGYMISDWKRNNTSKGWTAASVNITGDTTATKYTVLFIKNPNGFKMTDTFEGLKLLSGGESTKRRYTMDVYTFDDIDSITINGTPVKAFTDYGTQMTVTGGNAATGKMTVRMKDGVTYDVANTATVISKVYITLDSSYSLSPNTSYTITPGTNPKPSSIDYTFTPSDPSSLFTWSKGTNDVLEIDTKSTTGSAKVKATATFNGIEGGTSGSATATAEATISIESLKLKDPVCVNKGLDILLSKFVSNGSSTAEVTISKYPSIIKLDRTTGKISDIKITGDSEGASDDSLRVLAGGSAVQADIDVIVYPTPSLSIETSTSGPYKYTVKMPKGLYHDDVTVSEVSKAILEFKAVDHDNKTKDVTIDSLSDDSDNKRAKKGTKSIELKDLIKYIKDIAKDTDSQTIAVRAYAYNKDKDEKDDKVYSEKKEFTVYKINLDTTGNATYTVNGENVGGYFYGISDATYTIKSSATNGGKLDTKNSGDFNSGESIQYKVLGARTLKAVYGASNANTNAGGAGGAGTGEYDDVPKTGETRADIWILWSVLLIAILGAGFMIWKRFGLVRAIAAADEEMAIAQEQERVAAEKKAEKDKMDMLKNLRNL